jgi:hypothetical protein
MPKQSVGDNSFQAHYKSWQMNKGSVLKSFAYSLLSHQTETHTLILDSNHIEESPYFHLEECTVIPIDELRMISGPVYLEVESVRKGHTLAPGKKLMIVILIVDNLTPKITKIIPLEYQIDSPELQDASMLSPDSYQSALNSS